MENDQLKNNPKNDAEKVLADILLDEMDKQNIPEQISEGKKKLIRDFAKVMGLDIDDSELDSHYYELMENISWYVKNVLLDERFVKPIGNDVEPEYNENGELTKITINSSGSGYDKCRKWMENYLSLIK